MKPSIVINEPRYSALAYLCYQSGDITVIHRRKPARFMAGLRRPWNRNTEQQTHTTAIRG